MNEKNTTKIAVTIISGVFNVAVVLVSVAGGRNFENKELTTLVQNMIQDSSIILENSTNDTIKDLTEKILKKMQNLNSRIMNWNLKIKITNRK